MRIHLYLSLFFVTSLLQTGFATTFTAIANGNWGDGSTWDQGGLVPGNGDDVVIVSHTVLLGDYTGDVTVKDITLTNSSGNGDTRLDIYENVTVNANSITMDGENRAKEVELHIYGQAVVIISGKIQLNRKNDNNKNAQLLFHLYGNASVTVGNDFEYNYENSSTSEYVEEIRVEESAQLNVNGNLLLTKEDGGGEFNMFLAGGADINVTGKFKVFQQNGGDLIVSIQDSSTLTIGDTTTLRNSGGINQLKIDLSQINGFVQFTNEVHFDSNTDDNLVSMEAFGQSRLRFNNNLKMTGGTEGDIGLILGDTATLMIAGELLRPDNFGFIHAMDESSLVFNGTGNPLIDYSNLASSGKDSIYVAKMVLNNTSGSPIVLDANLEVSGHLELISGVLETSPTAMLIVKDGATIGAGNPNSYVDGPILKQGSTNGASFVFPLGDEAVYAPLEISAVSNPAFAYQAQYYSEPPPLEDGIEPPISNVSSSGYWDISKNTGADDVDVSLHWSDAAASGIDNPDSLLVVGLTDNGGTNTWKSYGNGSTTGGTGSGVSGSITNANGEPPPLDDITKLTLGSTNIGANALPVTLLNFSATVQGEAILLDWATVTEAHADYFAIEHSVNGKTFRELNQVNAYGTVNSIQYYDYKDDSPQSGINYYRLKQVDYDGNYYYSPVVSVTIKSSQSDLQAIPNLVIEAFQLSGFDQDRTTMEVDVYDLNGVLQYRGLHPVENGLMQLQISKMKLALGGMYHVVVKDGREVKSTRIVVFE